MVKEIWDCFEIMTNNTHTHTNYYAVIYFHYSLRDLKLLEVISRAEDEIYEKEVKELPIK